MGLLSRAVSIRNFSLEDPAQPLLPMSALYESLGLGRSDAGMMINEKQAMRITTVYGCIKVISEDLSRLSLDIYQQMPDRSMQLADGHRLYPLIHNRPNPIMSSMTWRGVMLASALSYGNGYSWIKRDRAARVISLVPLDPARTSPVKAGDGLMYVTTQTDTGQPLPIDPENMFHLMGVSLDGMVGLSPIQLCKNAFGLAAAAEKFGAQFFGNGARATGVFQYPDALDDEARENLKKSVREMSTGDQALRPMVLEEGLKWQPISIAPDEAQFIQTRKLQKEELACLYRVPMHLLQDLQRATNNNIEHQGLDYVRFCLAPWAVRIEQELNYKLLGGAFTAEHNFRDLERGDFATQTQGIATLRNIGYYSVNDIARQLRQNPIPTEEGGDVRVVQGAFVPLTSMLAMEDEPAAPEESGLDDGAGDPAASAGRVRILACYRTMVRDAVGRAINRGGDAEFSRKAFQPTVCSMAQTMMAVRFGNSEMTRRDLDLVGRVTAGVSDAASVWKKQDAAAIATRVTEQIYGGLAKEIFA